MTNRASQIKYTGGSSEDGTSVQRCVPPAGTSADAPVRIRVAVFFDGTLNNRTNVGLGPQGMDRGDSYIGALTNVAIMEKYYEANCKYDYCFSVYVEGVGTTDEEEDSLIAAALGIGSTGIIGKVQVGISKIIHNIRENIKISRPIDCIHVDAFGFSRGAAAARNFVYQTLCEEETLKLKLESEGYRVNEIKIQFVGLFDTVASFWIDHSNDTDQLHLDAIKHAEYVLQLAAADEHRKNFPLTNVDSAQKGQQLLFCLSRK